MLEDELTAVAARISRPASPDLAERVLARLDEPPRSRRRRTAAIAAGTALVAGLGLSPQVRAAAADLLDLAGIEFSRDEPDAPPAPQQPLPGTRLSDLDQAAAAAAFPLSVPTALGEPEQVRVADEGRVVTMEWRDGTVVLDQFQGSLGAVFSKQIGELDAVHVSVGDTIGWWIPGPHDLVYVDRDGESVTATARLAGRTLVWTDGGVTYRLEAEILDRAAAAAIADSLAGTS